MRTHSINDYIEKNISKKRKQHIYGVRKIALELAVLYNVDAEKVEIAALFHDMFKELSEQEMNNYVRQFNLDSKYLNNRNLAHSKIAAIIMEKEYNITDQDILNAVSYHTTGKSNMSQLEKIIFIADAIEPNRKYPSVEELRKIAYVDLNEACLLTLSKTIDYISSKNMFLDEDTIKARDYLKELKKGDLDE